YEMLTGTRVIRATSPLMVIKEILSESIAPPSQYNPRVSPELDAVVMRALEKRREDRWSSAQEFRTALRRAVGEAAFGPRKDIQRTVTKLFPGEEARAAERVREWCRAPATSRLQNDLRKSLSGDAERGLEQNIALLRSREQ